jgi:Fic family protein
VAAMIDLKNLKITPQMLTQIAEIDTFNGNWAGFARLRPEQLQSMKIVATIESIGSSNRIEGNQLSDLEIETLFKHINKKSFKSRDEEEVVGYGELLNRIFDDYSVIPLSENYIKQMHQILLQYSSKDERHRGEYKKDSNRVAAFDKNGKEIGTVFETATAFDTPRLISELIDWANKNLKDPYFHPLIIIGVFIVHFLSIHPFTDGNGRLSRALTTMLLLQKGYDYVPYSSLESIIEASKNGYYAALRGTQKTIWKSSVDYTSWLEFFITSLLKQKRHLESKIAKITAGNDARLGRTAQAILDLFNNKPEWARGEIVSQLGANAETIKKNLKVLVDGGHLIKHGATKGTWYEKAE